MMRNMSAWLIAAAVPMAAAAQNQPAQNQDSQQQQAPQQQQPQQQQQQQQGCQTGQAAAQPPKKSFVKDTGTAVAQTAGSVAGGAVAGPVGAAVGGVVVDHVGHAVKKVVKGKKKNQRGQQETAQDEGEAQTGCAAQPSN